MVLNNYKGGQLANRIVSFAHLIANSIEYDYKLVNPEFDEYEPFFKSTSNDNFNGYQVSTTISGNHFANQFIRRFVRLFTDITHPFFTQTPWYQLFRIFKTHDRKGLEFDLNTKAFTNAAKSKNVIVQGWGFRDHTNFNKHADILRSLFIPIDTYSTEVEKLLSTARQHADVLYGVHIRRGDYKVFEGGKYFFENEVYADKMLQLVNQQASKGKKCAFIICSNERIQPEHFPAQLQLFTGARHFITDLYCLAACDGIIGPPSTFSGWASFYGKVPLQHIKVASDLINIEHYASIV